MAERYLPTPTTPAFQERANAELCSLNNKLHVRLKQDINREVYYKNTLKHKEDAVVAQIRILRGERDCDTGSPESDVFVTPKASPDQNVEVCFDSNANTHRAYYSLVHLEEDTQHNSLERELAEQDELSKSFRSIIIKETRQKPTSLNLNRGRQLYPKDVKLYKATQVLKLNNNYSQKLVIKLKNDEEMNVKVSQVQKEEEIMSNPDSCLEPVSSGYVTRCSPRDVTTGSEGPGAGADSTEVASSEDMPEDGRSGGSSSVSSDPGTWDSTFPTQEDEPSTVVLLKEAGLCDLASSGNPATDLYPSLKRDNTHHHTTTNTNTTNNFFIDASSLRDENEMYLPSIEPFIFSSTNIIEPKTFISDDTTLEIVNEKSDLLVVRKLDSCIVDSAEEDIKKVEKDRKELPENRKLIRRNTFEFEPDDNTLSRLKQEYEKNQRINHEGTTDDKHVSPKHNFKVSGAPKEEDAHSPDSLNNDFPLESFERMNAKSEKINVTELFPEKPIDIEVSSTVENEQIINEGVISSTLNDIEEAKVVNECANDVDVSCLGEEKSEIFNKSSSKDSSSRSSPPKEFESSLAYFNKLECTPIVSGRSQISDVSSTEYSVSASPLSRRKTDFAPILSGGYESSNEAPPPETDSKRSKTKVCSLNTSWVVDMSDAGKSPPETMNENKSERNRCSSNSSLGFFIPLEDPYPSFDSITSNSSAERSDSGFNTRRNANKYNERNSSCGFFIDLKENQDREKSQSDKAEESNQEKKLFSMFIDIGNSKSSDSASPKSKPGSPFLPNKRTKCPSVVDRLSAKHVDKKSNSTSSDSGLDLVEHPEVAKGRLLFSESTFEQTQTNSDNSNNDSGFMTKRQSFYMFIENEETPVVRRKTLPSGMRQNPNRHSWNNELKQPFKSDTLEPKKGHRRSSSVSYDHGYSEDKFSSGPTSIEDNVCKPREKRSKSMLSSWHGPIKPSTELSRIIANGAKHEFREKAKEMQKSVETSDADNIDKGEELSCSIKSDEIFDASTTTVSSKDDKNRTFVLDEVSKVVNFSTNDLELSTPSHEVVSDLSKDDTETDAVQEGRSSSSNKSSVCDTDMNTPKPAEGPAGEERPGASPTAGHQPAKGDFVKLSDMDTAPAQLWVSSTKSSARMSRSIPEGSWIENKMLSNSASSRSLSRLFPHLYPKSRSGSREASQQSSMHSSIVEPIEVSTEEEGSCDGGTGPASRLGEDLLRMFLDEISPDVTVEVGGRRIKAHKCILSSRCQYFAGMLSGGWVESAGNVISLQGFSYGTVHFALCHIYSGASNIPDSINIVELATLADMLCLEGLKEVIMYTLKVKYCHFFHKPCSGCTVGVVECLPLAAAYSLDEIYRKSLRWITKHFVKVWPTKGFAALPKELQDKCFKQHIVHMSSDNILDTIMSSDKLEATIPNVQWAQPVYNLNSKLHDAAVKYLGQHFASVLGSKAFMNIGREDSWTVTRLEETLLSSSKSLSPDQSCQSYKRIKNILNDINKCEDFDWKSEFLELLTRLETCIEDCLIRQAGRAARTSSWSKLDLSLRRKIQEAACLVFTPGPRPVSAHREIVKTTRTSDAKPKTPTPTSATRRSTPAVPSKSLPSPLPKPKTPAKLAQVKSRYLEPKPVRGEGEPSTGGRRMSAGKTISSSDSSRNSSPAGGGGGVRAGGGPPVKRGPGGSSGGGPAVGLKRPGAPSTLTRSTKASSLKTVTSRGGHGGTNIPGRSALNNNQPGGGGRGARSRPLSARSATFLKDRQSPR